MIRKILCWLGFGDILCDLGFHDWEVYETTQGLRWYCKRCGKIDR